MFCLSVRLFLCQSQAILITVQYSLNSGSVIPTALLLFLKIVSAIWGLLHFHTKFKIICSSSVKNALGILIFFFFSFLSCETSLYIRMFKTDGHTTRCVGY